MFVLLCLTSQSMLTSRFIHVAANGSASFFVWRIHTPPYTCISPHLLYPSADGQLGCFQVLAIVNTAAVNFGLDVSFWNRVVIFSGYMPRSGTVGSYSNSVLSFTGNLHAVLHTGCTILRSLSPQGKGGSLSAHYLQHLLFVDFLLMTSLTALRWYLIVVLICISLIISNVEYLFMCLSAICMSSLEKCLFRSSACFLISFFFFFFLLCYMSCLCIWEIKPLSVTSFADIFSQSVCCLFVYLWFPLLRKSL